jgi:hypothetical protein
MDKTEEVHKTLSVSISVKDLPRSHNVVLIVTRLVKRYIVYYTQLGECSVLPELTMHSYIDAFAALCCRTSAAASSHYAKATPKATGRMRSARHHRRDHASTTYERK